MDKYPKSVADVNKYLKKKGVKEKLAKGRGYYYFIGGNAHKWFTSSVSTYRVTNLSYEQWYAAWDDLREGISLKKLLPKRLHEQKDYKIYCDLDGVLSDFLKQLKKIGIDDGPAYEEKYGSIKFWDAIRKHGVEWWSEMPMMPDGQKLWNYIKNKNVKILTAPAKTIHECHEGKRTWVRKNLGDVDVIIESQKNKYADKNSILIDDMDRNIDPWKKAGGIAIKHKSADDTIKQLKDLGI